MVIMKPAGYSHYSLVPRPCPAFCHLQYLLEATESWAGPQNEATAIVVEL